MFTVRSFNVCGDKVECVWIRSWIGHDNKVEPLMFEGVYNRMVNEYLDWTLLGNCIFLVYILLLSPIKVGHFFRNLVESTSTVSFLFHVGSIFNTTTHQKCNESTWGKAYWSFGCHVSLIQTKFRCGFWMEWQFLPFELREMSKHACKAHYFFRDYILIW